MTGLTTHVLDTALGQPAAEMKVDLYRIKGTERVFLKTIWTNDDGRGDEAMLSGEAFEPGTYELVFSVGDYLRRSGATLANPAFLEEIPIRFSISDATVHYHVPLLVSAHAYSTYRGS